MLLLEKENKFEFELPRRQRKEEKCKQIYDLKFQ